MEIRVALVGVGNVASALVQGVEFYRNQNIPARGVFPGMSAFCSAEIRFVCAFDINRNKVDRDLAEAIFIQPNCARRLHAPPALDCQVHRGPVLDGLGEIAATQVPVATSDDEVDVAQALRDSGAEVVVLLLPAGSNRAARYYAEKCFDAGCGVVNGLPAMLANDPVIAARAETMGLPIIGDDVKSQVGATVVHRNLARLFNMRGATLSSTIQLDWGGDMDFLNLVCDKRYEYGKRDTKTEAILRGLPNERDVQIRVSAADYISFLANTKEAYIRLEGTVFGEMPVKIDVLMKVEDGYNSAGVLVDMIRTAALARRGGVGGVLDAASAVFCKKPREQLDDAMAAKALGDFLQMVSSRA